ncbi:MAG: hypothetical protein KF819_36160 [Labilithrix sp.]|nr:hypothetical protein [Labilithrix sp.]
MHAARAALALALLTSTFEARADERVECARAYEQAQRLQQRNEGMKALAAADRCARPTCPALLVEECKQWSAQIRDKLVPVDVRVIGADACEILGDDAIVEVDRIKQASTTEIFVDPGIHEVRVTLANGTVDDKTLDFVAGERRTLDFRFAPDGVTCAHGSGASRGVPTAAVGLGIAGGVLLLTGITLGVIGASKKGDLDACRPGCTDAEISSTRTFFVAGDVVGGVGLLSLGAAAAVYFLTRGSDARAGAAGLTAAPRGFAIRF